MPTKRMIQHSVTLFNRSGSNPDGSPAYVVTVLSNVYYRENKGVGGMYNPADHAVVHIFDDSVVATPGDDTQLDTSLYESLNGESYERALDTPKGEKPYLPEEEWDVCENKEQYWTLHGKGNDYIVRGDASFVPLDYSAARRIVNVKRNQAGNRRMHGWKVTAE